MGYNIDVSFWNSVIDWSKTGPLCDLVICKALPAFWTQVWGTGMSFKEQL